MLLFAYGLLKEGGPLHPNLKLNGVFVGYEKTPPEYTMYRFATEPVLIHQGSTAIKGELWEVPMKTLSFLESALNVHAVHTRRTFETSIGYAIFYTVNIEPDMDLSGFEIIETVDWSSWDPFL